MLFCLGANLGNLIEKMMDLLEARKKSDKKRLFNKFWKYFRKSFSSKKNLKRDLTILLILLIAGLYFGLEKYFSLLIFDNTSKEQHEVLEKKEINLMETIQTQINTENWKLYKNNWYGFELKYPENWNQPIAQKPVGGEKWEQKIVFNIKDDRVENIFDGFEVLIYDTAKIKELNDTDEFPKLKNSGLISENSCFTINDHLLEINDYPVEEIYIPAGNSCYESALFFTNTRDKYIYNIIPKPKTQEAEVKIELLKDPQQEVARDMPDFFAVVSSWQLIDIYRPKPKPTVVAKPKSSAPMPVSFKKVNGLRVCAKKNDHPGKSKQNKSKHLDMECCLDPDERPNPHCYYPSEKYGKYL